MINTSTVTVHQLQLDVLHEINQLNQSRRGILEMEVDVHLASMPLTPSFAKQDICSVIHNNRLSKALMIYFHPKDTLDNSTGDMLFMWICIGQLFLQVVIA
jgi:hypothetical protein